MAILIQINNIFGLFIYSWFITTLKLSSLHFILMNILCISKIYEKYQFSNNDLTSQITIRVFLIPYQHRSIKFGDPTLCENLAGRSIKRRSNRSSLKHKITLVAAGPYPKKNDLCLMDKIRLSKTSATQFTLWGQKTNSNFVDFSKASQQIV